MAKRPISSMAAGASDGKRCASSRRTTRETESGTDSPATCSTNSLSEPVSAFPKYSARAVLYCSILTR
eukprot:scaffold5296_cov105-Isochrysis_galbana.AAC.13